MDRAQSKAEDGIWIAPDRLKETYCFSDDTRSRGIAVLEGTGVVYISRQPVNEDFGYRRVRNAYSIDPTILSAPVEVGAKSEWSELAEIFGGGMRDAWASYVQERVSGNSAESSGTHASGEKRASGQRS